MRHARSNQRLSRPSEQRQALLYGLVQRLVVHNKIQTTYTRAKEAQRLADRLVTLGKDGSIHARRQAFRVLQNRSLVKRLFTDIAPRFVDISGGYTRVTRLTFRRGDGAQRALLSLSQLPSAEPAVVPQSKPAKGPKGPDQKGTPSPQEADEPEKPKKFFEGLRGIWSRKKKGRAAS